MNISLMLAGCILAVASCNNNKENKENLQSADTDTVETVEVIETTDSIVVTEVPVPTENDGVKVDDKIPGTVNKNQNPSAASGTMPAGSYHMVVSFFSPGNGINREAREHFLKFLNENKAQLVYEETRWGREGEVDYCIRYEGSAAANPGPMSKKIRETLAGYDRINFTENGECVHKR